MWYQRFQDILHSYRSVYPGSRDLSWLLASCRNELLLVLLFVKSCIWECQVLQAELGWYAVAARKRFASRELWACVGNARSYQQVSHTNRKTLSKNNSGWVFRLQRTYPNKTCIPPIIPKRHQWRCMHSITSFKLLDLAKLPNCCSFQEWQDSVDSGIKPCCQTTLDPAV